MPISLSLLKITSTGDIKTLEITPSDAISSSHGTCSGIYWLLNVVVEHTVILSKACAGLFASLNTVSLNFAFRFPVVFCTSIRTVFYLCLD